MAQLLQFQHFFLPVFAEQVSPFFRLKDPKVDGIEQVEGEDCYVISGASMISRKETFWISTSRYLILKYYRSLEPPEEGIIMPEMTDQQVEEAVGFMGQEATEENKRRMREMVKISGMMAEGVKGYSIELHLDIFSPEVSDEDFQFALPEGAVLRDSLFGGMWAGSQEDF